MSKILSQLTKLREKKEMSPKIKKFHNNVPKNLISNRIPSLQQNIIYENRNYEILLSKTNLAEDFDIKLKK
jgi:hypothetical protein